MRAYWSAFALWHARGERKLPFRNLEHVLAIQNRRVRKIVRHAYETVPHYSEAMDDAGLRPDDFQTGADLARLPLVTARDLVRDRSASARLALNRTRSSYIQAARPGRQSR